jgi:predicted nucleic acid binding AN1-type Zn finger protein
MKCSWCSKKTMTLKCKGCSGLFCTRDIQLEAHTCTGIQSVKLKTLEKLEHDMPVVVAPKIQKI